MNSDIRILPYKVGSRSAKALADAMACYRINLRRSNIHNLPSKKIINWGNSGANMPPDGLGSQHTVFNTPSSVMVAGNKLRALQALSDAGVRVPEFTTEPRVVLGWLDDGRKAVARRLLTANSGEGIELVEGGSLIPPAPLYTQYVPKTDEYRVHVVDGTVVDVQRKARSRDVPDDEVDWQVRNLAGGFIFARENVNPPEDVLRQSVNAVSALFLDFGAVDVVWNQYRGEAYVLEVNTAPGLEGTTLETYTRALSELISGDPVSAWDGSTHEEILAREELSTPPVVQSIPEEHDSIVPVKYAVCINGMVDIHNGLFNTREEAVRHIDSDNIRNVVVHMGLTPTVEEIRYA